MKRLCAINPPVGQPDRLTRWVDEAVIIIRPALWYHPFTIYTCILALLVEKIFEVTPTYSQGAYMLNKPNFIYSLYMYRILMKRRN